MGGRHPVRVPQQLVASGMEGDLDATKDASENPAFLYITGDCVYFLARSRSIMRNSTSSYEYYPKYLRGAGQPDGENLATGSTPTGSCATSRAVAGGDAGIRESGRTAMTQPNVYWTLVTPFVKHAVAS